MATAGYIVGAIIYGIVVSLLTLTHEIWIAVIHYKHLEEIGVDPNGAFIDAIPIYIPFVLFFIIFISAIKCHADEDEALDHEGRAILALTSGIIVMFLGIFFHCIQIIVIMCKGIKAYLSTLPSTTTCFCYVGGSSMNIGLPELNFYYRCTCRIPYEQNLFTLVVSSLTFLNKAIFEEYGFDSSEPNIHVISDAGQLQDEAGNIQLLLLLIQVSLVIYVIRCPLWIALRYYKINSKIDELETGSEVSEWRKFREQATTIQKSSRWKDAMDYAKHCAKNKKEIDLLVKRRAENIQFFIELTYYGFTEGLDAFSLLEEFIDHGDYFKANHHLANAVLAFISISFLVIIIADALAIIPIIANEDDATEELFEIVTKFAVILINNVPFLVIRIYLFWLFGMAQENQIDTVFLLFIVKEVTVILLGIAEISSKIRKRNIEGIKVKPSVDE